MDALQRPELASLEDQNVFKLEIDLGQMKGATLCCPRGPLPWPQNVYVQFRLHRRFETMKLSAYERGREARQKSIQDSMHPAATYLGIMLATSETLALAIRP